MKNLEGRVEFLVNWITKDLEKYLNGQSDTYVDVMCINDEEKEIAQETLNKSKPTREVIEKVVREELIANPDSEKFSYVTDTSYSRLVGMIEQTISKDNAINHLQIREDHAKNISEFMYDELENQIIQLEQMERYQILTHDNCNALCRKLGVIIDRIESQSGMNIIRSVVETFMDEKFLAIASMLQDTEYDYKDAFAAMQQELDEEVIEYVKETDAAMLINTWKELLSQSYEYRETMKEVNGQLKDFLSFKAGSRGYFA